mmetsp:Transcript_4415/g.14185  ORF Transcript_4415/g.14185 Transcript_4415/m.14185 type:complete len:297 (-) Transcript_4415:340-1230(-)
MLPRVQRPFRPVDRFARRWDQALHQSPLLLGLRLVADGVDVCELAPPLGGGLEAELVDPHVCSELDALVHRHGLVHRPLVCRHGLVVVGGRPQDRTSLGRGDLDAAADGGEGGFSARVHLIEVHEEGEDARALRSPDSRVLVVVPPVELARLVPHDLEVLAVVVRRACEVVDPAHDAVDVLIRKAFWKVAPALVGGPHGVELVAGERALERLLAHVSERLRLDLAQKVVVLDDPWRAREDERRILGEGVDAVLEELVEVAFRHHRCLVVPSTPRVARCVRSPARVARASATGPRAL